MLLAELAARRREDGLEEFAGCIEITLRRDRPGQVIDRSKGLDAVVAVEPAHPFDHAFMELLRLDQIALSSHRDGELADCFQRVEMLLAQDPTAPGDHLFFEFTGGDEAAFGP